MTSTEKKQIRVTIWTEGHHEKHDKEVQDVYPKGMHSAIAEGIAAEDFTIRTGTFYDTDYGLPDSTLEETDVLFWWGHCIHEQVPEELVDRIQARVLDGMGLIVLHSGHHSKVFRRLMGASCNLSWREYEGGERERVWTVSPGHPIADGVGEFIDVPKSEMYGEPFDIPQPDEVIFTSWFEGGEVFRSGCCFYRGRGRIFYFSPGHEIFPIYHDPKIQRVLSNAVRWTAAAHDSGVRLTNRHRPVPLEKIG